MDLNHLGSLLELDSCPPTTTPWRFCLDGSWVGICILVEAREWFSAGGVRSSRLEKRCPSCQPGTSPAAVTRAHLCSALGTDHQDPSLGTFMRTWSPPGSELAAPIPGQQTIAGKRKGSHHTPCTVVKNSLADPRDTASIPGSGRSPGVGNGNLLQWFLPGKSHGQRSLVGYSLWGHKSGTHLRD